MNTDTDWKQMELRRTAFGSASALYGCSFEKDDGSVPERAEARRYVEHWAEMKRENIGLLLWGPPGNGKTFTAACVANALIEQGVRVRMTNMGTVLTDLLALPPEEKRRYLEHLKRCELLILDDFGMERRTDYAREQLYNLIDGRYLARKPLVVTTNLPLDTLREEAGEERRIYDRVLELCVPVFFKGDSLRRAAAAKKLSLARSLLDAPPDKEKEGQPQ